MRRSGWWTGRAGWLALGCTAWVAAGCGAGAVAAGSEVELRRGPGLDGAVDSLLTAVASDGPAFSGRVVLLGPEGVLADRARGFANVEHRVPVGDSTVFRIASISKQITGLLAARLAARGVLELDVSVERYLPALTGTAAGGATLRGLLDHTSGLPPNPDYLWDPVIEGYGWAWTENRAFSVFDPDTFVARFGREEPLRPPGTEWEYCNACYVLAARVMEGATGATFERLLREEIFLPLGMADTGIETLDTLIPHRAYGYERDSGGRLRPVTRFRDLAPLGPAGGMVSTMPDLVRWAEAVFLRSEGLSTEERELYFAPGLNDYALGLTVEGRIAAAGDTTRATYHTGEIAGVHALVLHLPEAGAAALVLSNVGFSFPHRALRLGLVEILMRHRTTREPTP